jgi:predicted MFS family arabinose efflux permease
MGADVTASRRLLVGVLFLASLLNFADRAVFSALAQTIKADLELSDLQLGLLQGLVFALLYAVAGMPIGRLAEHRSRTGIIAAATAIWSAATAATGVAAGFAGLALARLMVGLGEAGFTPPAASLVADVVPRARRASTIALVQLGSPAGAFLGATLAGLIASASDWRVAFFAFAVPGFLVAAALAWLVAEPVRGQADTPGPASTATDIAVPSFGEFLRTVKASPALTWVIAGGSLAGFGMTSVSQFMAVFLARSYHLDVRSAAASFGLISGVSLTIGLLGGSFGTDLLARRDPRWPAWGAAIGLASAPPLYWLGFHAPDLRSAFAILLVAGAMLLLFYGPTSGMIQNLLPARMRASGIALYTLLYTLIGSGLGPVFVGAMSDRFAHAAYIGNALVDCPHGLPAAGASEAVGAACRAASAAGLQSALSLAVSVLFLAALCFLRAASFLRADRD